MMDRLTRPHAAAAARLHPTPPDFSALAPAATRHRHDLEWPGQWPAPAGPCHIRWMIRRDMAEVLAIENAAFAYPWSEEDFIRVLRQRNAIGMVIEADGSTVDRREAIAGYMIYEPHKHYLRLLDFAVDPQHHGRGFGRQLVEKLKGKLLVQQRKAIKLTVWERNLPAQLFWKAMGFLAVGLVGDYSSMGDDGVKMEFRMATGTCRHF